MLAAVPPNLELGPPPLRVLVLDGQYCHALAAVRSLGAHGAEVTVAAHKPRAQGFASRWCTKALVSPSPNLKRAAYTEWLFETLKRGRYDATLFFEEATADILSAHRARVQALTGCPLPPRDIFLAADRKDRAARLARQLGVAVPSTYELETLDDAARLARTLEFPVIVKGVHSSGSQQVVLVRDPSTLVATVQHVAGLRRDASLPLPIVQQYVPGRGHGLTALMRRGDPVATFMHRRMAEHDIAAGVALAHGATGAVSVDEPEMLTAGITLLQALCWDGIAMVEFRKSSVDGRFYLIEINPRFVGSLELAIAAGVDFPWLFAQLAAGRPVVGPTRYRVGLRYRWLLSKNVADAFERPFGYALDLLSVLRPDTRCDLSLRDPRPHLVQLRSAAFWVREHLMHKPHSPIVTDPTVVTPPVPPAKIESDELISSRS